MYRERMPAIQVVALVIPLFIWSGIFAVLLYPPLDAFFMSNFFSWVPDWFFFAEDFGRFPTGALLLTWILGQPEQSLFGINTGNEDRIVIFGGGILLLRDGHVVGAVGVSGGTVDQDIKVAETGVAAF